MCGTSLGHESKALRAKSSNQLAGKGSVRLVYIANPKFVRSSGAKRLKNDSKSTLDLHRFAEVALARFYFTLRRALLLVALPFPLRTITEKRLRSSVGVAGGVV